MDKSLLNLYATYLQISSSQITATGLSELLEQSLSHDKITWFLSSDDYGSEDLYACVKSEVRYQESLQSSDAYGVFNNINENIEKHSNIRYFIVYLFS